MLGGTSNLASSACKEYDQLIWTSVFTSVRSGRSCLSPCGQIIAISNLYDGFDLYTTEDAALLRTFLCDVTDNVPLPAVFVREGTALIMGTSCGKVNVGDVRTGELIQQLDHDGRRQYSMRTVHMLTYTPSIRGHCAGSGECCSLHTI